MVSLIQDYLSSNSGVGIRLLETLIILLSLWVVRRLILRFILQKVEDQDQIYAWRKGTEYAVTLLGILGIAGLWFEGFENASTYLGLVSAGIAIALQDPLTNLFGWIYILTRAPFETGDRIEIGDVAGDVIDIHMFKFSLLEIGNWVNADQSTGRVLHVPNRMVFREAIANYNGGISYIWNEIPITLTFESDWQIAKNLLEAIAQRHSLIPKPEEVSKIKRASKRSNVRYPTLTPVVYTTVSPSGVVLTLRYLCLPRKRRNSEHVIWEEILLRFAEEPQVDFAYETQRIFYHPIEGKTLLTDHSEVAHPRSHLVQPENISTRPE